MPNRFTLSFGNSPLENISRIVQINTILDAFRSDPINQQIYMITGVRGSGKTVLLTEVENRLETDDDWIVVELNPTADLHRRTAWSRSRGSIQALLLNYE